MPFEWPRGYVSPAYAVNETLNDILTQQKVEARQKMLDELNAQNIRSEIQNRELQRQYQLEALNSQRESRAAEAEKRKADTLKDLTSGLGPGIEFSGSAADEMQNKIRSLGGIPEQYLAPKMLPSFNPQGGPEAPDILQGGEPGLQPGEQGPMPQSNLPPVSLAGPEGVPEGVPSPTTTPAMPGSTPPLMSPAAKSTYVSRGTPQQQADAASRARAASFIDTMMKDPTISENMKKALQLSSIYEGMGYKNPPPWELIQGPKPPTDPEKVREYEYAQTHPEFAKFLHTLANEKDRTPPGEEYVYQESATEPGTFITGTVTKGGKLPLTLTGGKGPVFRGQVPPHTPPPPGGAGANKTDKIPDTDARTYMMAFANRQRNPDAYNVMRNQILNYMSNPEIRAAVEHSLASKFYIPMPLDQVVAEFDGSPTEKEVFKRFYGVLSGKLGGPTETK